MASAQASDDRAAAAPRPDRRALRRLDTIEEILEIALDLMARDGVGGLNMSDIARRLGVQPPSLYKYFPSRMAVYDALFLRGQQEHLEVVRAAVDAAEPGLAAIYAGQEAASRWGHANQALAQLLFWRPVPGFVPSAEAMAPSVEMVETFRGAVRAAVSRGELGQAAATAEGVALLSVVHAGVVTQQMANEPDASFDAGRFTSLINAATGMFVANFPPDPKRTTGTSKKGRSR
jgi:AcrR family transcriptional regulator